MNSRKSIILVATLILAMSTAVFAQSDPFGKTDTIYAEAYRIDDKNWAVNVSLFNDEEIMALSIPFVFSGGMTKVVADSTVYTGGLVEAFRVKQSRVDTTTQCLTIGLISDVGVSVPPIPPGKGRIATVFVSALDGSKLETLKVDTTTTPPGNNLQLVSPPSSGIVPAFVIVKGEKAKEEK
ncbi:MAG: hypothetical protein ABIJ45_07485 [Candidatus Zixiibacteriota bacterium]